MEDAKQEFITKKKGGKLENEELYQFFVPAENSMGSYWLKSTDILGIYNLHKRVKKKKKIQQFSNRKKINLF